MKRIFCYVILFSSIITAQSFQKRSLIDLKHLAAGIGHQTEPIGGQIFNIRNQASSPAPSRVEVIRYQVATENQKKNPALAILYSMLLPGMGELYAGSYESGMYFTIADGALWGVFAGFNIYGNWQEDNYRSFAESKAGVKLDGKESDYFANLGLYLSVDEYNRVQELNRNFEKTYNPTTHYWNWVNNDQRKEYRNIWSSSEQAFNNVRFIAGALVLNRIISAINAVRLVSAHNKELESKPSLSFFFSYDQSPTLPASLVLNLKTTF